MPYILGSCIDQVIALSADRCGDIDNCPGTNQLRILDTYAGTTCSCAADPGRRGLGILTIKGRRLVDSAILPAEDWVGHWHYGSNNTVAGIGDLNGDSRSDFIVNSPWGIGVMGHTDARWQLLLGKPSGTRFGGWNFNSRDNVIRGVGDFNGDGKDDLVLTSPWGVGVLTLSGSTFSALMSKPSGTRFGGWNFNSRDNVIRGVGDFNGDGKDDLILTSPWGVGILTLSGSTFNALMMKPNGTWFGGWNFNSTADRMGPIGDFDGDGREDFVIRSSWGTGLLRLAGTSLVLIDSSANGELFGSWLLENEDKVIAAADFEPGGKVELLLQKSP
jgi:hypothetical protein